MPRIRSIKPQFWTSEQVAECSPNARLLFIGLWNFCDDYGIHPASVKRAKMEIFPSDDFCSADIRRMIGELIANGLLVEYEIDGTLYWCVTGWDKHQKPDTKTGLYPMPDGQVGGKIRRQNAEDTKPVRRTVGERSPPEKEKEKEKEVNHPPTPKGASDAFERFWSAYPRKVGKGAAEKAWQKAKINGHASEVVAAVESQKRSEQWQKDGGQFIPNPATWLNQRRWEDEIVVGVSAGADNPLFQGML